MAALKELLSTDIGLLSLLVLLFLVGMGVFFARWFVARVREDEAASGDTGGPRPAR